MNIYLLLLKPLLTNKTYIKYKDYINYDFINKNYPEVSRLYQVLPLLHKQDKTYTVDDLRLVFYTAYPKADEGFYGTLFAQLDAALPDETHVLEYLKTASNREKALALAKTSIDFAEGKGTLDGVKEGFALLETPEDTAEVEESYFVTDNLVELYDQLKHERGIRWRLDSLNAAIGELRKGNFGFVFARPETGKTTFLASELTFMAGQVDRPIIWFNNEQGGPDVRKRITQSYFGITEEEMKADLKKWSDKYEAECKGKILLYDKGGFTKQEVEKICKLYNPSLVVFDQIDKIKGFAADRNDLELKEIYMWARELCKKYCPVIGICQAGASGENKKWLTMNDVDNSKTGKQGEADFILGIGATFDQGQEYVRFMHLSKNKLHPEDKQMRHGRWQTLIRPEIARYQDF